MNKLEDCADEKDGILETKGKLMCTTGEDKTKLKMIPKVQKTKIHGMLKDMKFFVNNEIERKQAKRRRRLNG